MVSAKPNGPASIERKITIRPATEADIEFIVACHTSALPNDVLPAFGETYLKRFYQAKQDQNSDALLIAEECGTASGFALVITEKSSMLGYLRVSSILLFAVSVLHRPSLLMLTLQQFARKQVFPDKETAEIAFIAVNEHAQGRGIGSVLIGAASDFARNRNFVFLSTKTANETLAEHYRRRFSAETQDRFAAAGRNYTVLRWPIS